MKNDTRNSLARIPLRWMIRECFKLDIGILFDMDMLENEVGLDTSPIRNALSSHEPSEALSSLKPPEALPSEDLPLIRPDGIDIIHIPAVIVGNLCSPFRRVWKSLQDLRVHDKTPPHTDHPVRTSDGEAHEELVDARSPIYDQYKKHIYWKIIDQLPCKLSLSPQLVLISNNGLTRRLKGHMKSQRPSYHIHTTNGPMGVCKSPPFVTYHRLRAASLIMSAVSWNCGRGRKVYQQVMPRGMKVHRSVETRLLAGNAGEKPYRPKIRCEMRDGKIRRPTRDEWLVEPTFDFTWVD